MNQKPFLQSRGCELSVLVVVLDAVIPAKLPDAEVLVVAPALNSWLRRWVSDEDAARRRAEERVAALVDRLERRGVRAAGRVGDADPLLAIADALSTFPADEILIAARTEPALRLADELCRAPATASRSPSPAHPSRSAMRRSDRTGIDAGRRCPLPTTAQPTPKG